MFEKIIESIEETKLITLLKKLKSRLINSSKTEKTIVILCAITVFYLWRQIKLLKREIEELKDRRY